MKHYLTIVLLCLAGAAVHAQYPDAQIAFRKVHLWDAFYTEASTIGDINKDGKPDIVAGARWFEAPDWKAHDIWTHK